MKTGPLALLPLLALVVPVSSPQVTFQARADAVLVDVAVTRDRAPVPGLTKDRFTLTDNGLAQEVLDVTLETALPLDVSLVVDTSVSVAGPARTHILSSVKDIAGFLRPDDHLQLFSINGDIETAPPDAFYRTVAQQWRGSLADGGTPLFDAVALAAMHASAPGRRHAVIALTDGVDTSSLLPEGSVQAILRRADATLDCVEVAALPHLWVMGFAVGKEFPAAFDREAASFFEDSGGRYVKVQPEMDFISQIRSLLDELRQRYLLRYVPAGVDKPGWHDLHVTVTGGTYDVRARKGYQK
jgi:VWFA-related protein